MYVQNEPQRLYPAWHGRSATLAARRLARLNYSRTAKTDEGYLPLPKRASTLDPERGAANLIGNYATICGLIAEHAEQSIPDTFDRDQNRACIAWEVSFLFGHATDNGTIDSNAKRTFRRVLESLQINGILTVDEWTSAPMIAEALAGQILGEATANSPAPKVLTTTMGHRAGLDGTVRTFRHHIPVIDTFGNREMGHHLEAFADAFLKARSDNGQLGEFALLGSQDRIGGDVNAGATARYGANGELRKACPAAHGNGDPDAWHLLTTTDYFDGKMVHNYRTIDVGNQYLAEIHKSMFIGVGGVERRATRAVLTYQGGDGRDQLTTGKARHIKIRSYRYSADKATGEIKPPKGRVTTDVRGWGQWRTLNAYAMSYDQRKATGHLWSDKRVRVSESNRPTTSKGRTVKAATHKPEQCNATNAANRAAEFAMTLYNAHRPKPLEAMAMRALIDTLANVNTTPAANAPKSHRLETEQGTKITVALRDRGYAVRIVESNGKRHDTTTSAPEYVEAIVRNRLALIG